MALTIGKLIMPDKCLVCGDVTLLGVPVCPGCVRDFCALFEDSCPVCHKSRRECSCGNGDFGKSGKFLFYYLTPVSKAVIASIKHGLDGNSADFIAELIYRSLKDGKKYDCVVYPPRTKKNISRYGFDQAREISAALASKFGIKSVDALSRKKKMLEQKLLSASQRRRNVMGMFRADSKKLAGCGRVLLFDDIYTTGATVKACEIALREAGVREVVAFTVAYTPRSKPKKAARTVRGTISSQIYRYKRKH